MTFTMIGGGDSEEGFSIISLDSPSCELCQLETGEDVNICKICQNSMRYGPIKYGFNYVSSVPHANVIGHEGCFQNHHRKIMRHLQNRNSVNLKGSRHDHKCNKQKNSNSLGSNCSKSHYFWTNFQLREIELRQKYYKFLFGEESEEYAKISKLLNGDSDSDSDKDFEEQQEDRLADSNISSYLSSQKSPAKDSLTVPKERTPLASHSPQRRRFLRDISPGRKGSKSFNLVSGIKSLRRVKSQTEVNLLGKDLNEDWVERKFMDVHQQNLLREKWVSEKRLRCLSCQESYTRKELGTLNISLLRELVNTLQHTVTETSSTLVEILEDRDDLRHENRSLHVTIQKLVRLQSDPRCSVQIRIPPQKEIVK